MCLHAKAQGAHRWLEADVVGEFLPRVDFLRTVCGVGSLDASSRSRFELRSNASL
jgi:hypothetical protein